MCRSRIARKYQDIAPLNKSLETPDKANAFFLAGVNLELRDDDPDYPALVLGNYMLGGGFLNSRLGTRIRQKEGLSYGVGTQLEAGSLDKSGAPARPDVDVSPSLQPGPPVGPGRAGLTSKPHHAQQPRVALRGSFRLRLASTFNHRPAHGHLRV